MGNLDGSKREVPKPGQTMADHQQPLRRDSQLRHHTPLQLHLRLKDMAIWPPNLEKCSGEPSLNPNLSQSGGSLWTQFEIPHHWFQKFYSNF